MKTVGFILKEARLNKKFTLAQVESATKIRLKFLEAIENDDYAKLPSLNYAKGFVKNYAEFLGLSESDVLAFFRRQTTEAPKSSLLPKSPNVTLNHSIFRLTPGRFLSGILVGLVGIFLLYFLFQYQRLNMPPNLTIISPVDQFITTVRRIDVIGLTDSDATVTINGIGVLVRSDGRFFDQVSLEIGVNKINVTATSRFGKTTTLIREVGVQQTQ